VGNLRYPCRMLAKLARIGFLIVAAALAVGSSQHQGRSPQYPYPASSQGGVGDTHVPGPPPEAVYVCTEVRSGSTLGSFCYAHQERCDRERRKLVREGAQASACRPVSPVACFQLGDDQNPRRESCAESIEDCELLRFIDKDKNGSTGQSCEWRHGLARGNEDGPDEAPPRRPSSRRVLSPGEASLDYPVR